MRGQQSQPGCKAGLGIPAILLYHESVSKLPSDHHSIDQAGYKLVSQAARCVVKQDSTVVTATTQGTRQAIPAIPAVKRSRIIIQSSDQGGADTAYISSDGVNSTEGYPLKEGKVLDLPVSPGVRIFAVKAVGSNNPDLRTLELG